MTCCCILAVLTGCSSVRPGRSAANLAADPEQTDDALAIAMEHARVDPSEPYWPYRIGEIYAGADSIEQSINSLQSTLSMDPGYAPAAALLSKIYYDGALYNAGVTLLEDFIAKKPGCPDAIRAALALHLEALGDVDRAQTVLLDCSENSREVHAIRTYVTLRGDNVDSALQFATQALESDDKSAANQNNYGVALLCAGRPIEAREAFMKALRLDKDLPGALYNMAIVEAFYFFDEQTGKEWFARYQQYASEDPDDLGTLFGTEMGSASGK